MLGISVYPEKASKEEVLNYLTLASSLGYKRVFTCLLSVNDTKENIKRDFKEIITHGTSLGMEVVLDVSPAVFSDLGISYDDLSFFGELGATGIRLDESFSGSAEAAMTFNPYNMDIEINMSNNVPYLELILAYMPKKENLIASHNFYPQKYCGLGLDYFLDATKRFNDNNIRTAIFIDAKTATVGPWPVTEGLCTLEMHRSLDAITQVKHIYAMDVIDDVLIAAQFASKEELEQIAAIDREKLTFRVKTSTDNSELENIIMFDEFHFNRGDQNEYLYRSTMSRVKYKAEDFPAHDTTNLVKRGSIVIGNNGFGQYKGELQVVKKDIIDEALARNVVGQIIEEEVFLLDYLKPWQKFKLERND